MSEYEYDVCLSFAGEQRPYVEEVAGHLRTMGIRVFYDSYEEASLWGKNLFEHLDHVYRTAAKYCVIFASAEYAGKVWTSHERRSAQARALVGNEEYILPARFDDTEIPGLLPTVKYLDLRRTSPRVLAERIHEKTRPEFWDMWESSARLRGQPRKAAESSGLSEVLGQPLSSIREHFRPAGTPGLKIVSGPSRYDLVKGVDGRFRQASRTDPLSEMIDLTLPEKLAPLGYHSSRTWPIVLGDSVFNISAAAELLAALTLSGSPGRATSTGRPRHIVPYHEVSLGARLSPVA